MAELLIAIAIIGVVAAIMLPSFMAKTQERELNQARNLMHFKLNEAMNQMQVNEKLTGYNTAEDFVKALGNYLRIMNTCDSNNLDKCFPKTFLSVNGEEEYDVTTLTTGSKIVAKDKKDSFPSNNVGLTLPNGTMILLNYDKDCTWKNPVHAQNSASGDGRNLSAGSVESTACLAMLMDVNGNKKPNKIGKDILNIGVTMATGLDCEYVGNTGICMTTFDVAHPPVDCTDSTSPDFIYCGTKSHSYAFSNNYWAGGNKACAELGGHMPTRDEWKKIGSYIYDKEGDSNGAIYNTSPKEDRVSEFGLTYDRGGSWYHTSTEQAPNYYGTLFANLYPDHFSFGSGGNSYTSTSCRVRCVK